MLQHLSLSGLCAIGALLAIPSPAVCRQQQTENSAPSVVSLPLSVEQQKLLEQIGRYAEDYVSNLPNFICQQVTHQFEAGRKPEHWRKLDTLGAKLVFADGREERTLETINDKPPSAGRIPRQPLQTEGEFGILLGNVFGVKTNATFMWNGWQTLRGKRVAVFDYLVDNQHSTLRLGLSDFVRAVVPYRGSIYADPDTGAVWRITSVPFDIPSEIQTRSIATVIDYDSVDIGGQMHLLPVEASVTLDTGSHNVRNRIEFREYRKFEAESKITFAPSGSGAVKQ
ncbi:MAG TPA: hypothetical protein VGG97_08915 [Bryobacteraceae bacterium]